MEKIKAVFDFVPFLLTKPAGGWGIDVKSLIQAVIIAIVTAAIVNRLGIVRLEEQMQSLQKVIEKEVVYIQKDINRLEMEVGKLKDKK